MDAAATVGALRIVAGYPEAGAGEQHVIRARAAAPGVDRRVGGDQAVAGREALHAFLGDGAGTSEVAAVRVLRPALMPAEVGVRVVRRGGEQRVAARVVDPGVVHGCLR